MFDTGTLNQIAVGKTVGVLKIFAGPAKSGDVRFIKKGLEGFDGVDIPENFLESDADRTAILQALEISDASAAATSLVGAYSACAFKRELVALLGSIGGISDDVKLSPDLKQQIRAFLSGLLTNALVGDGVEQNAIIHRQALLALALQAVLDFPTCLAVASFLSQSTNFYEISAVAGVFQCHQDFLGALPADQYAQLASAVQGAAGGQTRDEVLAAITGSRPGETPVIAAQGQPDGTTAGA